ncbi:MAG TPA: hypothetical protein VG122_15215, partial [Gemmata sp.]|nr:hypothetical protein [Gemmata sp.]
VGDTGAQTGVAIRSSTTAMSTWETVTGGAATTGAAIGRGTPAIVQVPPATVLGIRDIVRRDIPDMVAPRLQLSLRVRAPDPAAVGRPDMVAPRLQLFLQVRAPDPAAVGRRLLGRSILETVQ